METKRGQLSYQFKENTKAERDSFAKDTFGRLLGESSKNIEAYLSDYDSDVEDEFLQVFDKLFVKCYEMQQVNQKNTIKFLHIFYLKSALFTGHYELQINLFDEASYFDKNECEGYWVPAIFMKHFDQDIEQFYQEAKKKLLRFDYGDYQEYRVKYYDIYLAVIGCYIITKLPKLVQLSSYQAIEKTDDFKIVFGGYMDKGMQIYPLGEVTD